MLFLAITDLILELSRKDTIKEEILLDFTESIWLVLFLLVMLGWFIEMFSDLTSCEREF